MILTGYISVTDHVWKGRPHPDAAPISVFTNAQESVARKLEKVRKAVHAAGADSLLLGTLEDVAWLTNLRGRDIACTPVFTSYLLVTDEDVTFTLIRRKSKRPTSKSTSRQTAFPLSPTPIVVHTSLSTSTGTACFLTPMPSTTPSMPFWSKKVPLML